MTHLLKSNDRFLFFKLDFNGSSISYERKNVNKNITSTEKRLNKVALILPVQEDNGSNDMESTEKSCFFH